MSTVVTPRTLERAAEIKAESEHEQWAFFKGLEEFHSTALRAHARRLVESGEDTGCCIVGAVLLADPGLDLHEVVGALEDATGICPCNYNNHNSKDECVDYLRAAAIKLANA